MTFPDKTRGAESTARARHKGTVPRSARDKPGKATPSGAAGDARHDSLTARTSPQARSEKSAARRADPNPIGSGPKTIVFPKLQLNSVKLVQRVELDRPPASSKKKKAAQASRPQPSETDLREQSLGALGKKNPIWADILGRETAATRRQEAATEEWDREPEVMQDKPRPAAAELGSDWFYDAAPLRDYSSSRRRRLRRAFEGVVRSRRFGQAIAAMIVVFFVSSLDVPWRNWFSNRVQAVQNRVAGAFDTVSRPFEERAAFFIAEDFQQGLAEWSSAGGDTLQLDSSGLLAVSGFALHEQTRNYTDYRLDIDTKIQRGGIGWVVRASDYGNYYAYRLVESGRRRSASFHLERYTVIDGLKQASASSIRLPDDLAKEGVFNRISQRVRGDQITTMINGWGVDFWRDSQLERGGIGLFAKTGDRALVQKLNISGNDDAWGLLLYGTVETLRSVRDTINSPLAGSLGPASAPLAVVLHPMPSLAKRPLSAPAHFR